MLDCSHRVCSDFVVACCQFVGNLVWSAGGGGGGGHTNRLVQLSHMVYHLHGPSPVTHHLAVVTCWGVTVGPSFLVAGSVCARFLGSMITETSTNEGLQQHQAGARGRISHKLSVMPNHRPLRLPRKWPVFTARIRQLTVTRIVYTVNSPVITRCRADGLIQDRMKSVYVIALLALFASGASCQSM